MNLKKLKQAEKSFLRRYPGGFNHPEMLTLGKKHKMDQMIAFTQEHFAKGKFSAPETMIENIVKVIGRSSMVSVFEKPKFKDFALDLALEDQKRLVGGLKQQLYGKEQKGFETILDVLKGGKLAKWSLMTICPLYFRPQFEVYVKPTTAKGVIDFFELKSLTYHPTPTWAFYEAYRALVNEMKAEIDPRLSPNNAAFTGFLMMSLDKN